MSTAATRLSVDEYLSRSFKPACEYFDGVLRQKSIPTKLHALIQFLLVTLLRKQGVEALAEVSIKVNATRFLIPDVIADSRIEDPYPTRPVALCVEILSPDDRLSAAFVQCEEYHAWGVPYCWVIDPMKRTCWEYHAAGQPAKIESGSFLGAGAFSVPFDAIFDGLAGNA